MLPGSFPGSGPRWNRTSDLKFRKFLFYPTELADHDHTTPLGGVCYLVTAAFIAIRAAVALVVPRHVGGGEDVGGLTRRARPVAGVAPARRAEGGPTTRVGDVGAVIIIIVHEDTTLSPGNRYADRIYPLCNKNSHLA